MSKVDQTMQKKIIDKITEMETSLLSRDFKTSLKMLFDLFAEKMRDDKSPIHVETLISGVLQCANSIRLETKLCACVFLFSFLSYLPDKARLSFNKFAEGLEKDVAPKLYDLFTKLQTSYVSDKGFREAQAKKQFKFNTVLLILLSVLMILELCANKFGTDKSNRPRRFESFYTELQVSGEIKEQLEGYTSVNFDALENKVNFFERADNENPDDFKNRVKLMLKGIAETREEMRFYLNLEIDDESAKRFDAKTDDYKNQMYDLQEFIQNKKRLLDENLRGQIAKEEQFSKFLLNDLANLYAAEELTISEAIKIISSKYEEIFYGEREGQEELSHESLRMPEVQKQPFTRTDSELSDFISPNRFKSARNAREPFGQRLAFFPQNEPQTIPEVPEPEVQFEDFAEPGKSNVQGSRGLGFEDFPNIQESHLTKPSGFGESLINERQKSSGVNPMSRSQTMANEAPQQLGQKRPLQRANTRPLKTPFDEGGFEDELPMSAEESNSRIRANNPFAEPAFDQNNAGFGRKSDAFADFNKSPGFGDFKAQANPFALNAFDKPFTANFEDFENVNQSSNVRSDEKLQFKDTFKEQPPAKAELPKPDFASRNMDFNSVFLGSPEKGLSPEGFDMRGSVASGFDQKFKTSKIGGNLSIIEKRSMSSFLEKKSNAKIQLAASRFTTTPKADNTQHRESKAILDDALKKVSTLISTKKTQQPPIKSVSNNNSIGPGNFNNNLSQSGGLDKQAEKGRSFMEAIRPAPSLPDKKSGTPFTPAYEISGRKSTSISRANREQSGLKDKSTVQISFGPGQGQSIVQPSKLPEASPKTFPEVEGPELPRPQTGLTIQLNSVRPPEQADNNFVFEMDDFNSVHSDKLQTPPEQSIQNYSNMIPANLKVPLKTPSQQNFSQNFELAKPGELTSPRKRPERALQAQPAEIRSLQELPGQVAPKSFDLRPEAAQPVGPNFDNLSAIKNANFQSNDPLPSALTGGRKELARPLSSPSMGGLGQLSSPTNKLGNANNNNLPASRSDLSDNLSQLAVDDKVLQAKASLERGLEEHKQQLKSLASRMPLGRDRQADQLTQQYTALFEKMMSDYESLVENNKYELKEHKNYAEELSAQLEKYKNKAFNLENELIALKDSNLKMNVSLCSMKKKYEANLSKQKELVGQQKEAKYMAMERSYQERMLALKNEHEAKIIALNEEINNFVIENNNLKLENEFLKTDKKTDLTALREKIEGVRQANKDIQRDMEGGMKALRESLKSDLSTADFKKLATLKRARDELLDTLHIEQKKTEDLSKQVISLSNECSVLRSNVTFTPNPQKPGSAEKADIALVKAKTARLKQMVKEASWIIHCMLSNLRHHLAGIRRLKAQELTSKVSNFQNVTASQLNELTKLNFQCQNLQDELLALKEKHEDALEQNQLLQKQFIESRDKQTAGTGVIASDPEFVRKFKQLEYENKSLSDLNRQISSELIQSKEKIIVLQAEGASSEKVLTTLKNLEIENEELMEMNKCLFNELYESKGARKNAPGSLRKPERLDYSLAQNRLGSPAPISANNITIVNNMPAMSQTHFVQNNDNSRHSLATGTAFIKKFDMFMDILNSQDKSAEARGSLLDWLNGRPAEELGAAAHMCVSNSYVLIKSAYIKLASEEEIAFKNSTIIVSVKLTFSNLFNAKLNVLNLKVGCGSKFFSGEPAAPLNLELLPFESAARTWTLQLEENYLLQMSPVFVSFCLLDQFLYSSYVSGSQDQRIIEDNFVLLALPLTMNKLLMTQKEDASKFSIVKNLQNVGEVDLENCRNVTEEDLFAIFPNITEISLKENIYGVKVNSLFGTFFLTILIDGQQGINLKVFSMYKSPLHTLYLQTLKFILENL